MTVVMRAMVMDLRVRRGRRLPPPNALLIRGRSLPLLRSTPCLEAAVPSRPLPKKPQAPRFFPRPMLPSQPLIGTRGDVSS